MLIDWEKRESEEMEFPQEFIDSFNASERLKLEFYRWCDVQPPVNVCSEKHTFVCYPSIVDGKLGWRIEHQENPMFQYYIGAVKGKELPTIQKLEEKYDEYNSIDFE